MAQRENYGILVMCVIFALFMAGGVGFFFYQQGGGGGFSGGAAAPVPAAPAGPTFSGFPASPEDSARSSVKSLTRQINADPEDVQSRLSRAAAYEQIGDYDLAIEDCDAILALKPEDRAALFQRASLHFKNEAFKQAREDLDKYIEGDANNAMAFDLRGDVRSALGDHAGAAEDYTESVSLGNQAARTLMKRAAAYGRAERYDDAIADYDRVVQIYPNYGPAYRTRGWYKMRRFDYEGAQADMQAAIRYDPTRGAAHADLGRVKMLMGDLDGALADASHAISLHPFETGGYAVRAGVHTRRGDFKAALADIDQALSSDATNDELWRQRAWVNWAANDLAAAESDFHKALGSKGESLHSRMGLGVTKLMSGDFPAAVVELDRALKTAGSPLEYAHLFRWLAHTKAGNAEEADSRLREFASTRKPREANDWPGQLIEFLLGSKTEEELLAAAAGQNERQTKARLCEAYYYAGEMRLLKDREGAAELFGQSVATEERQFYEYYAAQAALRRTTR